MYLHLKIYLFLRSHQFLNNINFKLADMLALFFQHQTWGESEDVLDDQDKQIKTQVEDV